jgi:hypothetical protein
VSAVPTVEPCCVCDTFITGAGPLQFIGDNLRLTLHVSQRSIYDGSTENAVVSKLVGSRADMLRIAAAIVRCCNEGAGAADDAESFAQFLQAPAGRH